MADSTSLVLYDPRSADPRGRRPGRFPGRLRGSDQGGLGDHGQLEREVAGYSSR